MQYSYSGKALVCELTQTEQLWLRNEQPQLFYLHNERKAYGYFSFNSVYNGCQISDRYEIAIDFARLENHRLPLVYEVGNKIWKVAKLHNKPINDLHQYDDRHLCLIRPDVFLGLFYHRPFDIQDLCILINSFLYWQSYFYIYNQEPWPGEKHGYDWLKLYINKELKPTDNGTSHQIDN